MCIWMCTYKYRGHPVQASSAFLARRCNSEQVSGLRSASPEAPDPSLHIARLDTKPPGQTRSPYGLTGPLLWYCAHVPCAYMYTDTYMKTCVCMYTFMLIYTYTLHFDAHSQCLFHFSAVLLIYTCRACRIHIRTTGYFLSYINIPSI